jgi:hypothetical protein
MKKVLTVAGILFFLNFFVVAGWVFFLFYDYQKRDRPGNMYHGMDSNEYDTVRRRQLPYEIGGLAILNVIVGIAVWNMKTGPEN